MKKHLDGDCRKTCLYRHYDADGKLIYVGITINLYERVKLHKKKAQWYCLLAKTTYTWYDSWKEAHAAEIEAIEVEKPIHNIAHSIKDCCGEEKAKKPRKAVTKDLNGPAIFLGRDITIEELRNAHVKMHQAFPFMSGDCDGPIQNKN